MNRAAQILVIAMVGLALAGCARTVQPPAKADFFDSLSQPYTLDTGDRLRVIVFGQADLSNIYPVDGAGRISMPLVGQIETRGLTTRELEDRIRAKLRNGLLRDPHVTVDVDAHRPFFILGEVTQSGQFPYVVGMTVQNAVAIAGGFTPRAQQSTVEITRTVNGELVRGVVPLHHPLKPGDTVRVFERWF